MPEYGLNQDEIGLIKIKGMFKNVQMRSALFAYDELCDLKCRCRSAMAYAHPD